MTYKEARAILPLEHICNELARQKALEALDKQIPKKVKLEINQIGQGVRGVACFTKCPCCRQVVLKENNMCFCTYCGQALDWSDEE